MNNISLIKGVLYWYMLSGGHGGQQKDAEIEVQGIQENHYLMKEYCESRREPVAAGRPQRGWLINGERVESTECLRSKTVNNYGTGDIADLLNGSACHMNYLTGARLSVYDISRDGGGRLKSHRSHQNGLDVDVGNFRMTLRGYENSYGYMGRDKDSLGVTWEFLRYLKGHRVDIEHIFWSPANISALRKYVITTWGEQEWEIYKPPFSAERGHGRHMHIRIRNPAERSREMVARG